MLTGSGIRLGVVVSDLHGKSTRAMIKAIIAGQEPHEVLRLASRRLKASYRFVLDELMRHIEHIEARIARFDTRLLPSRNGRFVGPVSRSGTTPASRWIEENAIRLALVLPSVFAHRF